MNVNQKVCNFDDVQKVIIHVIDKQDKGFGAKALIDMVKQELAGTEFIEKANFCEVARMCGRTLRDMRLSGKLVLDEEYHYIAATFDCDVSQTA